MKVHTSQSNRHSFSISFVSRRQYEGEVYSPLLNSGKDSTNVQYVDVKRKQCKCEVCSGSPFGSRLEVFWPVTGKIRLELKKFIE